ncbi:MAG: hypothetical protein GY696_21340 [Gammaproteobacteria bacterium]|nr:hypothetical protein [Gammaproteobacteria bacterium]
MQLDGIYLIPLKDHKTQNKVTELLQLAPREIDLRVNTAVALDYMAYHLTRQIEEAIQDVSAAVGPPAEWAGGCPAGHVRHGAWRLVLLVCL